MKKIDNLEEFVEKFDAAKKQNPLDLSSDQDLVFAIMNLISIEEHLIFTGLKTEKTSYYDAMLTVRDIRKKSLQKIIKDYEGEIWCTSKHLLAACMRFMEVGTKQMSLSNKKDAYECYSQAYEMYCLFWGFNMKLLDSNDLQWVEDKIPAFNKANDDSDKKVTPAEEKESSETKPQGAMSKLGAFLKKAVNCCIE
jgi:hypothetical protein